MASSKYGKRWVCFSCGCKFYDLKKPVPLCPKCGSDQSKAPKKDTRFSAPVPEDYDVPEEAESSEDLEFQEDEEIVSGEAVEELPEEEEE